MLLYNVQQYWWLWAGLAAGVAVTVIIVLTYFPLWRKRPASGESEAAPAPQAYEAASKIPWVLLLITIGLVIFGVAYTVRSIVSTPNW